MSTSVMVKVFNGGNTSNKLYCMRRRKQKDVSRYKKRDPEVGCFFTVGLIP